MFDWNWSVENEDNLSAAMNRCRQRGILLPTFSELRQPEKIDNKIVDRLKKTGMQDNDPVNLFRIHWQNDITSGGIGAVNYMELPPELTGVKARIIGLIGKYFPTGAHKVGATYGCLAPYLVNGRFNPEKHKAVWPSTGNYCRGGVFNSNLLDVFSVAILPEEMSRERFDWLKERAGEVYATPGCESNVKEIYDKCHELEAQDADYIIFNQFSQFGNAVWHYNVTGAAIEKVFHKLTGSKDRLSAYVSATGSAGTIAAGDYLRTISPAVRVTACEALQCPTLLENGFGGHRIEGIGDKHIPWIHNVRNTDMVCAVDDALPLRLLRLFNEDSGRTFLTKQSLPESLLNKLPLLGISSLANLISAVKLARYFEFNEHDVIFTIFTDSADMYRSRLREMNEIQGSYTDEQARIDWHLALQNLNSDSLLELTYRDRKRIHNLKYFTWIEQQGKSVDELNAQWYDEDYWPDRFHIAEQWDMAIRKFNRVTGLATE